MRTETYLTGVRDQYEAYPFPLRRPEDERRALITSEIDRLGKIDHFCFGGKQDFGRGDGERPFRVLVAGGGTGDALIYLGEQLRNARCELVYLDMSAASMEIAVARARERDLGNVTWLHGSILELSDLELEEFDYINCVGVLHHLEDPAEGLRQLESVLAEDGGMGLMLYGAYGRRQVYRMQEVLSLLCRPDEDLPARVETARSTLADLASTKVISGDPEMFEAYATPQGDAYLVDNYLHGQDRPFTVSEIHELLSGCGLHLASFTNFFEVQGAVCPAEYDPLFYFSDPELRQRIGQLPVADQQQLAENLNGSISMHAFYVSRRPDAAATVRDLENTPYFLSSYGLEVARAIVAGGLERVEVRFQNGLAHSLPINAAMRTVLTQIDGERTIRDICKNVARVETGRSLDDVVREVLSFLDLSIGVGLLLLRSGELAPLPVQEVERHWNGAIDLRALARCNES